ncbi:hypothetical protein EKO27_g5919 [Xylaria grammica]|uniref:BZIP domain-containing protein n=1 Tax=Xylaria grammica TaxID=363999 RepID=A0A439D450_9PEZI|nr:hypothetical protein EKO27_g5919 [Xylaria grammica]
MSDRMSIDKQEQSQEHSEESVASTPDNGGEPTPAPPDAQPVKRKGGRKPLEDTIRVHESNLTNLQAAHRSAAEECLMLRYKNSLLERILLEKGIDVQAELQAKTGSPNLGPTHMPQNMMQPPPIQRAILNRHHNSRRSASSIAPKLEPGVTLAEDSADTTLSRSFTNKSNTSIQWARRGSLTYGHGPGSREYTDHNATTDQATHAANTWNITWPPSTTDATTPATTATATPATTPTTTTSGYLWTSTTIALSVFVVPEPFPAARQEYDAPTDMMDEAESEGPSQNPYASGYSVPPPPSMPMQPPSSASSGQPPTSAVDHSGQTQGQNYPSMTQLLDPALDWDPFGLSASMAFPTQFSFDTSNMR